MSRSAPNPWVRPVPVAAPLDAALPSNNSTSRIGYLLALTTVALVFSRLIEFVPDFIKAVHPAILLMGFGAGIAVLSGGIARVTASRVTLFLLLFTVWAAAGLPFSVWRMGVVQTFVFYWVTSLLAYFIVTSMIVTLEQCRSAMLALAAAILVVLVLGFFRGSDEGAQQLGRFAYDYGSLRNQNILAMIVLMGLPFCAMAANYWTGIRRLIAMAGVGLIGISVFRTGSRAGMLGLGIVALLIFWRASMGGKLKLVVVGALLGGAGMMASSEGALVRFKTIFLTPDRSEGPISQEEATAIDSTMSRAMLLHRSLVQTLEHPLLGVGMGQFMVADSHAAEEEHVKASWRATHNSFTQLSSETGLPGLFFYGAAMFLCFRKLKVIRKKTRGRPELAGVALLAQYLHLALVAYAVCSFFDSTAYECYFPILAALTVSFGHAATQEIERLPAPSVAPAVAPPAMIPRRRAAAV